MPPRKKPAKVATVAADVTDDAQQAKPDVTNVEADASPVLEERETKPPATVKLVENTTTVIDILEHDYRRTIISYDYSKNKTRPVITVYEKSLLLGKRATQLAYGAKPNIDVKAGMNVMNIAEEELRQRKIPLILKRTVGNIVEYWRPADMILYDAI